MRDETLRWLEQAEEDLETARISLDAERFYAAAQFGEQAAEKALKGLYIDRKLALPPRTHALRWLAEEVDAPTEMLPSLDAMADKYLTSRYPDAAAGSIPARVIDEETARWHVDLAERTLLWVREQLSTP